LLTADHGFIYQHRPIEESDLSGAEVSGETVLFRDRRFVLGKGLQPHPGLRTFDAASLGLEGDVEVAIPKSINRLRLKGSGSRYVHGGASLQEVVIPVLTVNKKRQSDLSAVEVEIVGSSNKTITSSQMSVLFYQSSPVTEKAQPRRLRAGIFSASGELISDSHDLLFDFRSENPRETRDAVRFLLSKKADDFNGQEVTLRLEERTPELRTTRITAACDMSCAEASPAISISEEGPVNALDQKINERFPGLVVRKDLVKAVKGNAIVPTYVLEYLLGQYCATSDEASIQSGIETVKEILRKHYVHRNEAGLVRSNIREKGRYKGHRQDQRRAERQERRLRGRIRQPGHQEGHCRLRDSEGHPKLLVSGVMVHQRCGIRAHRGQERLSLDPLAA